MVKAMILISRREDVSPEAFRRHFDEQHKPLVQALPGLRRLVVNYVLPDPNAPPPPCDAIAEDWFDDPAAMAAAFASPAGQAVLADAQTFLDLSRLHVLVVAAEEVAIPA